MIDLDTVFDDDRPPGAVVVSIDRLGSAHPTIAGNDAETDGELATRPSVTALGDPVAAIASPNDLPGDWRIEWEERAAIREYEGGQTREHAEAEAFTEVLYRMRAANSISDLT